MNHFLRCKVARAVYSVLCDFLWFADVSTFPKRRRRALEVACGAVTTEPAGWCLKGCIAQPNILLGDHFIRAPSQWPTSIPIWTTAKFPPLLGVRGHIPSWKAQYLLCSKRNSNRQPDALKLCSFWLIRTQVEWITLKSICLALSSGFAVATSTPVQITKETFSCSTKSRNSKTIFPLCIISLPLCFTN